MIGKILFVAPLVGFLGFSTCFVQAENNYVGGNFASLDYSQEDFGADLSLNSIVGRLGMKLNENISGEIRAGVGVGDDSINVFSTDVKVELDSLVGIYARGGAQVGKLFYPYAVLGYTRGEITASITGAGSQSESDSDVSFGAGADIALSRRVAMNLEYMNYLDKDGSEVRGFSLGLAASF